MKTMIKYLILALVMPFIYIHGQDNNADIIKAYELRMDGKTEEAINILSNLLKSNPTDAMAHFEMARALENEKKSVHIIKAIEYDPDNLMYSFYQANMHMLEAYKAMKTNNQKQIKENLDKCIGTLNAILKVKPNCKESLLFLIDIYGTLPEDMGGNKDLASTYLKTLKEVDNFYGAQGELIIKSKEGGTDMVKYWKNYIDTYGEGNEALIKLGKAYLMTNDITMAKTCFNKVMENDPEQVILNLDVARAYLYSAMRGSDNQDSELKKFKENINLYLETEIEKPKLIESWCYGWLGMVEGRQGNKKLADTYITKAESLIPNYPRFTAIPKIDQPPNVVVYQYKSYFSPF